MQRGDQPRNTQAGKMLVPLLGVLAILAMGVAAVGVVLLMKERDTRQAKERELQLALAENKDLSVRIEEIEQAKAKIEEDLREVRKDLTQSQEDLLAAAKAQETLTRSVEDREKEIGRLTKDLEQIRSESKQITAQVSALQTERDAAKQQLADLEQAKTDLESKVMELSGGQPTVELEKVLVTNDQPSAASGGGVVMPVATTSKASADGQVVVVNREYDFIVMNLGKNHGLSVGQEFQIVRGAEVLGKVKVEKVYDELSAAAILPESQKNNIREGDAVKAL